MSKKLMTWCGAIAIQQACAHLREPIEAFLTRIDRVKQFNRLVQLAFGL